MRAPADWHGISCVPSRRKSLYCPRVVPMDRIDFAALTDVGKKREQNEDNFLVDKKLSLFLVCDGMGGHSAGEVASALAVRTVHDELKKEKTLLDDYASG